jgi:hypothetical protein
MIAQVASVFGTVQMLFDLLEVPPKPDNFCISLARGRNVPVVDGKPAMAMIQL